ncbi:MAG: hypothetical protein KF745_11405 [Phycisphaeraceae bacterium]|nr:hypothetical protein [Phycisphaeraceae bacterium]
MFHTSHRSARRSAPLGLVAALGAAGLLSSAAIADPPELDLSWSTVDAGTATGVRAATVRLSGTVGQHDIDEMSGGDLSLQGGLWSEMPTEGGNDCLADWDGNGAIEPADIAGFINDWLADLNFGTTMADIDGADGIGPTDVAVFITTWLNAVTNGC